ncbi:Biosynthetic Aromatic amino acid aminotransferase beta [hydrothermal vent metagenome]|uniref:Biosynthetic Aromatic amino acid aminotransferase beta n=1 Tax=hydrothermal vent metagenome TaxID=652676 RepID=A0A3B0WTH7_9ZZZZ
MPSSFLKLATSGVQQLTPYQPGKPVEELERELGISNSIKLASNENPLGPSLFAIEAINKLSLSINYYPDGGGFALTEKLAQKHKIDALNITLGNGSNDILELVTRAFLTPQHSAVFSEHSFAVYPIVVQAVGAKANIAKAYAENHATMPLGHDPDALLSQIEDNTRIIFIANPNNPTGTWLTPPALEELFSNIKQDVIIVLDLAYTEYMDEDIKPPIKQWLEKFPNLVVTQTFSKVYALAGLRIGYSLSNPEIAAVLNRVRQPFNTNMLAQSAAIASLDDNEHVVKSVAMNNTGKSFLQNAFTELNLNYLPTMGNFISVNVKQNCLALYQKLLQQGVIVRPVANYDMPEYLRITIGTQQQNERFIKTLKQCL